MRCALTKAERFGTANTGWSQIAFLCTNRSRKSTGDCSSATSPVSALPEVVAIVDQNARATVLRKLPLKKTDVDVPEITDWTLLDLADTRGDGQVDVILVGDAYEDHWLEVVSIRNGSAKTIFSGLGYYL